MQDGGNWGTGDDDDWDTMTGPDWEGDWTLGRYSQEAGWEVNMVGKGGGKGWDNWTKGNDKGKGKGWDSWKGFGKGKGKDGKGKDSTFGAHSK